MGRCLPVVLFFAAIGCASSRVPFTPELANQFPDESVRNLQFYLSSKIVLRRDLASSGKSVTPGHSILIEHGRQIEEVVVKKGVPGVAIGRTKGAKLSVSFEPPVEGQEYFLDFEEHGNLFVLRKNDHVYGTEMFKVVEGAQRAVLEVDAAVVDTIESRRRKAPGRVLEPKQPD